MRQLRRGSVFVVIAALICGTTWARGLKTITVGPSGADFISIQAAVNAAPETGAVIREVVHVDKPKIFLAGADGWDSTKVK